jgi:hypothetical protein
MITNLLICCGAVVGLFFVWTGVQALGRRQSGEDCDGPDAAMCGCCASERASRCGMRLSEPEN